MRRQSGHSAVNHPWFAPSLTPGPSALQAINTCSAERTERFQCALATGWRLTGLCDLLGAVRA
jgi:hypothetical protein